MFVDVHSHVVPSGDDGVGSVEEGLELCRAAAERGTSVLFATPHVWPQKTLTAERERIVREAYAEVALAAAAFGLDLRLGFELTPTAELLEEDPNRYRLGDLPAVLMEVPFAGPLGVAERLAEHVEAAGLTPVIAHPERAERILDDPGLADELHDRGWLLQVNATSLLGRHGSGPANLGWLLVERGRADLVASDGHRTTRPPFLDAAYEAARARVGEEDAVRLFDGSRLPAADALDLAQRG